MPEDDSEKSEYIRRILAQALGNAPIAHEAIIYRFGLENSKEAQELTKERHFAEVAALLGLDDLESAESLIDAALRKLRGS